MPDLKIQKIGKDRSGRIQLSYIVTADLLSSITSIFKRSDNSNADSYATLMFIHLCHRDVNLARYKGLHERSHFKEAGA
jgi:hypothetical protein